MSRRSECFSGSEQESVKYPIWRRLERLRLAAEHRFATLAATFVTITPCASDGFRARTPRDGAGSVGGGQRSVQSADTTSGNAGNAPNGPCLVSASPANRAMNAIRL